MEVSYFFRISRKRAGYCLTSVLLVDAARRAESGGERDRSLSLSLSLALVEVGKTVEAIEERVEGGAGGVRGAGGAGGATRP